MIRLYVASKVVHAPRWREIRETAYSATTPRVTIVSTWLDDVRPNPAGRPSLYRRCVEEASTCDMLLLFTLPDEKHHGALIEVGAALSHKVPVYDSGNALAKWTAYPGVIVPREAARSPEAAFLWATERHARTLAKLASGEGA